MGKVTANSFKFAPDRQVLWPVVVDVPMDGGPQQVEIRVRYRLLTSSEQRELADLVSTADVPALTARVDALLLEHVTGWDGLLDEAGEPIPYSREQCAQFLDRPYLREAFASGLHLSARGALAKN